MRNFVILTVSFFCITTCTKLQSQNCEGQINVYPINLISPEVDDLNFLNTIITNRNFFFLSEAHGNPYSFLSQQKLIRYFTSQIQLKWIAIEADYSHGYALNQFFDTGNVVELRNYLKYQPDYTAYEQIDYITNLQKLKNLHDSLGLQFKFIGIDVCKEGFKGSIFTILNYFDELKLSSQFEQLIDHGMKLINERRISYGSVERWMNMIKTNYSEIRRSFESEDLLEKFNHLQNIVYNVSQSTQLRSRRAVNREFEISDNFKRYIKPNDYVFCQFGYGHVLTNRWPDQGNSGKSFVDWLETENMYSDKSIVFAFSPQVDDSPEFKLFGHSLCLSFKQEIRNYKFPVLVDFRNTRAFNNQFQFAFIIDE